MLTPYVPHIFGDEVERKLRTNGPWLTAGVASSIPWPVLDVCILYSGDEYFIRGSERDGKPSPPGITIRCRSNEVDTGISKIYRVTSILSWFLEGYIDVSGYIAGSRPFLYGDHRRVFSDLGQAGTKSFNCNHMPIIEDEKTRIALAFWREGLRLTNVHDSYAFLSFYKVIESKFPKSGKKGEWISEAVDHLSEDAAKRVAELRGEGLDVSRHIFDSGRCAVAHASLGAEIVDPDLPADRRRLSSDLVIIRELARTYIRDELRVPTAHSLYRERNRLEPWEPLLSTRSIGRLRRGRSIADTSPLDGLKVAIGLWPDGRIHGLEEMTLHVDSLADGVVKLIATNSANTVMLSFLLDFPNGRIHTNLEESGFAADSDHLTEEHVRAHATFFYHVLTNRIVELYRPDAEPIYCEVVIPVNIIPPNPVEAIEKSVQAFRKRRGTSEHSP